MVGLKKALGAAALVAVVSIALTGTASAQWFGGYSGHCGSGFSFSVGSYYTPVYTPCYPTYTPCYTPVYTPCYPTYYRRRCW